MRLSRGCFNPGHDPGPTAQPLHGLKWTASDHPFNVIMSDSTLSAISSCSRLVSLDLSRHVVVGASSMKLLLEMPRLEVLAVDSFRPDVPVKVSLCCLKSLQQTRWDRDCRFLARFPPELLHLPKLLHAIDGLNEFDEEDGPPWDLGAGESAEAIAVAARDVHAAARVVSLGPTDVMAGMARARAMQWEWKLG